MLTENECLYLLMHFDKFGDSIKRTSDRNEAIYIEIEIQS